MGCIIFHGFSVGCMRKRGLSYIQAYLSSIHHKNLTPCRFFCVSSQTTSNKLIQGPQNHFRCQINSRKVTFGLHTASWFQCWMNQNFQLYMWIWARRPYSVQEPWKSMHNYHRWLLKSFEKILSEKSKGFYQVREVLTLLCDLISILCTNFTIKTGHQLCCIMLGC